ncbi:MAG: response regulator [Candidatus Sumerlaeota bacterium]|nr:response regulator [Candidatus Sumerlaeota bacterium]
MRILIADDDDGSRLVISTLLKRWGYGVIVACDGNEAWAACQQPDAPRLIILDWMMPGMDGVEVCRKIREQESGEAYYIILLTALNQKKDIVHGLEAGANDYVTKPFDRDELRARIRVGQRVIELQSALAQKVKDLEEALTHLQTLQGLLPICMYCHKIRTDKASWQRIEGYIEKHSGAKFSHGICPECFKTHYPHIEKTADSLSSKS